MQTSMKGRRTLAVAVLVLVGVGIMFALAPSISSLIFSHVHAAGHALSGDPSNSGSKGIPVHHPVQKPPPKKH